MKIVTGYRGIAHITSGDVGAFNASVFGDGQYVMDSGEKLAITVVSNNQVRIGDGDILMNGRHITIEKGLTENLAFENNTASTNRNDLVVCRYRKDSGTGVESAELVVIKGTAVSGTASDPSYNKGNILNGDDLVDMPLYRVKFTGITMGTPETMFGTLLSVGDILDSVNASLKDVHSDLDVVNKHLTNLYTGLNGKASTSHNHNGTYAPNSHNHDDRYYTETEVNNRLANVLPIGTIVMGYNVTTFNYGEWNKVGYVVFTYTDGASAKMECYQRIS